LRMMVHYLMNAYHEALDFDLPCTAGSIWRRWIDTALPSPQDIVPWVEAPVFEGKRYRVEAHSVVALYATIGTEERSVVGGVAPA
jgi:isoamylase